MSDKSDDADNDDVSVCALALSPINDDHDDDICAPAYSPISFDHDDEHVVSQAGKYPSQ